MKWVRYAAYLFRCNWAATQRVRLDVAHAPAIEQHVVVANERQPWETNFSVAPKSPLLSSSFFHMKMKIVQNEKKARRARRCSLARLGNLPQPWNQLAKQRPGSVDRHYQLVLYRRQWQHALLPTSDLPYPGFSQDFPRGTRTVSSVRTQTRCITSQSAASISMRILIAAEYGNQSQTDEI